MTSMELLPALLLVPLVAAALAFASRWAGAAAKPLVTLIHAVSMTVLLLGTLRLAGELLQVDQIAALHGWMQVDSLGAVFLGLVGVVGFLIGVYAIGYMNYELAHGAIDVGRLCNFYGIFNLFVFTMLLAVTANNVIMMWVAVEATTLGSAFLVGFYGKRSSLEAAWKYVVICPVGVAFGLYGVVLVYSNGVAVLPVVGDASSWTALLFNAQLLDPTLVKLAFVFVLIGFGTKAGLFPMHAWLPDAHSEAPSPISALLSAVLLNCAMLIVLRFGMIAAKAVGPSFPQTLLLIFGLLSVGVAAFFIVVQRDIKRLLAYSSVENMGLIAFAFGLGGPLGILAGLLHTINHSLVKALMFCGSGNILIKYGTPAMDSVKGILKVAPITGALFIAGALALGGVPPFNIFVSEFMVVTAGLAAGHPWLIGLCLLLLTVVLAGLVRMLAATVFGAAPDNVPRGDTGALTLLPMGVLLVAMLVMGIRAPAPVGQLLARAAAQVQTGSQPQIAQAPAPGTAVAPTPDATPAAR